MGPTPPPGYTPPATVYLVEDANEAGEVAQIGAFFNEHDAEALLRHLRAVGLNAWINVVVVHHSLADYDWDR